MTLLPQTRSRRPRPHDDLVGREPPLKRPRKFLGGHPIAGAAPFHFGPGVTSLAEQSYGVGAAQGHGQGRMGSDPFSSSVYGRAFTDDTYLGSVEARAWPLGLRMEEKMPSVPTPATAFIDRYICKPEPLQLPDIRLGFGQNETHAAIKLRTEIQDPIVGTVAESRSKTKLCKHFIVGNCKFKESCSFAHSIEELKKLPAEGDDAGKALLEKYQSKADAEKLPTIGLRLEQIQTHVTTELHASTSIIPAGSKLEVKENPPQSIKTKLCKHFLTGFCKYKESCTFAHSMEELRPPAEGKDAITTTFPAVSMASSLKNSVTVSPTMVYGHMNDQKVGEAHEADDKKATFLKTRLCKYFEAGQCIYEDKCKFSHGLEELRKHSDQGVTSVRAIASTELQAALPAQTVPPPDGKKVEGATKGAGSKFDFQGSHKTKPCKFFLEGTCRFGDTCNFLHGNEEMHMTNGSGGSSQPSVPDKPHVLKATYKTSLCTRWEKGEPCLFGSKCHFAHGIEELRNGAGLSIPGGNNSVHTAFKLETCSGSKEVGLSSILPYSYEITDTNYRPFLAAEEAWNGFGRDLGSRNERLLDVEASEVRYGRGWNQSYGQLEQENSWISMSPLGGANSGLTSNALWQTR